MTPGLRFCKIKIHIFGKYCVSRKGITYHFIFGPHISRVLICFLHINILNTKMTYMSHRFDMSAYLKHYSLLPKLLKGLSFVIILPISLQHTYPLTL